MPEVSRGNSLSAEPKISAVLCTFNEDYYLDACLSSLAWADELVVCDMGSIDETLKIAEKYGAIIRKVGKVDFVELLRQQAVGYCSHEWICFADPDFIFPVEAVSLIKRKISDDSSLTCISMRYVHHYSGTPVWHGRWGGHGRYPVIFRKSAMMLPKILHNGFRLKFGAVWLAPENHYIRHMWVRDEQHFYEKHKRYINNEGYRRLSKGFRPSLMRTATLVMKSIKYYLEGGFLDGAMGYDLFKKSIWYEVESEKMLKYAFIERNRQQE